MSGTSLFALLLVSAQAGYVHQHGHGDALLAVSSDGVIEAEFIFPGDTLYGFEREPQTVEESEAVREADERLGDPDALLRFNERAGCTGMDARIGGEGDAHSHHDITITVRFQCAHPDRIAVVGTDLFALFPRIEQIEGILVSDTVQTSFVWTASETDFRLPR